MAPYWISSGLSLQDLPTISKGGYTLVNISKLTPEQIAELAFTQEEREQLKKARMMPITYDEDCPPVTPERARNFRRANSLHTAN